MNFGHADEIPSARTPVLLLDLQDLRNLAHRGYTAPLVIPVRFEELHVHYFVINFVINTGRGCTFGCGVELDSIEHMWFCRVVRGAASKTLRHSIGGNSAYWFFALDSRSSNRAIKERACFLYVLFMAHSFADDEHNPDKLIAAAFARATA